MEPNDYDAFGEAYSQDNETNLLNAHYERPAMLALAGEVRGRRVLDAGCGSGPLLAALRDRGAEVSGFDASEVMVGLARRRLGDGVDLRVADVDAPLPYDDAAFDDVVVSLVLHYLEDWSGALAELHRVLRPGGRLLVSVNHPTVWKVFNPEGDYFAVTRWSEEHEFAGRPAELAYWHRPLHAMTDAFTAAAFRIAVVGEPPFEPSTPADLVPEHLTGRTSFLCFLFFVLEAV